MHDLGRDVGAWVAADEQGGDGSNGVVHASAGEVHDLIGHIVRSVMGGVGAGDGGAGM